MSKVGFIGTGAIAAPMARALVGKHQVTVSERNRDVAAGLAALHSEIAITDNQGVVDASDIVFLCLRPAVWADAVAGLNWRPDQAIVSVMAGVSLNEIATACAPVTNVSMTIPYAFIEHGRCPLPVAGNAATVKALFGADNPVLPQESEAALTEYFAASSVVSGALGLLETASRWLGDKTGDANSSEIYVSNLVSGVLADMPKDRAGGLSAAIAELATPNTLNLQMVEGMARDGAYDGLPSLLDQISASMVSA